ncbi:MAG TPA: hypothetical protein DD415_06735 [Clostridiales bacterium]|nr:hypothetical protein [Clostridiales bacterium]
MKKATKWAGFIIASAVCVTSVAMLAACSDDNSQPKEYTVTYYDGTTVLDTQKVKEGEKATKWIPEKTDYTFVDWYATPNFAHLFPFDEPISEDKSAFAQWSSAVQSEDTRTFYIVGSGTSPMLRASDWGHGTGDQHKMTKAEGKNEYTYTLDLNVGDKFQFEISGTGDWMNQRGVGYLDTLTLENGTTVFSGSSTIGDNSSYRLDIKCEYAGNYTFTLTTHPDDDTYETNHPAYTEANKEAFNINPLDKITWVRNGEVSEEVDVITDYYIKGAQITNWKDMYNPSTKMTNKDGVFTLEVYLKENDEFMFSSRNTIGAEVSTGTEYIYASSLDEASKAYVSGEARNMTAKASGTYKFTYTEATKVLTVSFDAEKVPAAVDYYLDGTYGGGTWGDFMKDENKAAHKFAETTAGSGIFVLNNVKLAANDELVIRTYAAGTEKLTWDNGAGSYNFDYLSGGGSNFVNPENGTNIKVVTAGTYNITFDGYAKMITIENANSVDDAYIVGTMTGEGGWKVSPDWKMTLSGDNTYTIEVELAVNDSFGVKVMKGETTEQKYWFGASTVSGAPVGFDVTSNNITCKTAGTYIITCTVTDGVGTITISSKN